MFQAMDKIQATGLAPETTTPDGITGEFTPGQRDDALPCPNSFITIRVLSRGMFGKVELVVDKRSGKRMVLKYYDKMRIRMNEFLREFQISCRLAVHPAVLITYDKPVETDRAFIFVQEYAKQGDLLEAIPPHQGLDEDRAKSCISQTASAISFMHKRFLVHGNVKPENILVFDTNMTVVKLSDFKNTQRQGDTVKKKCPNVPYTAPESCSTVINEGYVADYGQDVWSFGVLLFCVLTGAFPWGTATPEDTSFRNFSHWQKRRVNVTPIEWRKLSSKMQKLLRKILHPKAERRCAIGEINKYMNEQWLETEQEPPSLREETCSLDSTQEVAAMDELRQMLARHGVVTNSNSTQKMQRTDEWVQTTCRQALHTTVTTA
ncbi:serine/threonine-protein kinase SBK1-like [Asterias rubens]|uniref:serine/threonine-protein kinase SBK1-like n=1 Tax=Asterias rubens TaxID=7604 RepID=UPI001455D152|nr:serine/threonine-protein kinase SBK1-like [Asterias rubens]